jgi:hypothetical protein
MTDRATALRVLAALRDTAVGDAAVLVGSSALFGFETSVPALTEDIDIAVPEALAASEGDQIVEALAARGFRHEAGTATFIDAFGATFDLLGHDDPARGDHIGGAGLLRVMVFEDISRAISVERAVAKLPGGGFALTPAGFVATKLLTERGHKGQKDKLQALLVLAERRGDEAFEAEVVRLLRGVDRLRMDDALASAQEALLALGRSPTFSDAGAEGYKTMLEGVERGFEQLGRLVARIEVPEHG